MRHGERRRARQVMTAASRGTRAVLACLLTIVLLSACATLHEADQSEELAKDHEPSSSDAPGRNASFYDLRIGSCYDLLEHSDDDIRLYDSCEPPHLYEVYAEATLPDTMIRSDGDRPDRSAIRRFVSDTCDAHFEGYVGTPPQRSQFQFTAITPSEESWAEGDRQVLCVLELIREQPTTGSAMGSGR